MSELRGYPKIYALGHKAIRSIFDGPVVVQEKIDGSQFSFGVIDGELICRSRSTEVWRGKKLEALEIDRYLIGELADELVLPRIDNKLFREAVWTAYRLFAVDKLVEGWIYRGEVISRPKHNTLEYGRVPKGNIILFDVDTGLEDRLSPFDLELMGRTLDLEAVPTAIYSNGVTTDEIERWLEFESCLGGCKIEGVVVKNYNRFSEQDGKMLMGKYVNEDFKEKHKRTWKAANPNQKGKVERIILSLSTDARFEKGVQRRRDAGLLQDAPEDIGPIMADIMRDTVEEERDWIKEQLYVAFEKEIIRSVAKGFPQWYKNRLLEEQFAEAPDKNCITLPDGDCVSTEPCMHTLPPCS